MRISRSASVNILIAGVLVFAVFSLLSARYNGNSFLNLSIRDNQNKKADKRFFNEVDDQPPEGADCIPTWTWTSMSNSKMTGGKPNKASSLSNCKTVCVVTAGCSGFDWDPAVQVGHRCWLSGPWCSEWINGTAKGITHYILKHNCEETPKSVSECPTQWKRIERTQTFGGRWNGATTVDNCKTACLAEPGCDGCDWNDVASAGYQCWLTGPWIYGWNRGVAEESLTHYELVKNC